MANESQGLIEQNVRVLIGDLHLQLIMARARIAELEAQLDADKEPGLPFKTNGRADHLKGESP